MSDTNDTILDAIRRRNVQRRDVLKYAGQATVVAGGLTLLSACGDDLFDQTGASAPPDVTPTPTPSGPTPTPAPAPTSVPALADLDIPYFQFLLNIEYLRASFFLMTSSNTSIPQELASGSVGTMGQVATTPKPLINFTSKDIGAFALMFATEMANNTVARIIKLRNLLGAKTIAIPQIDIEGGRTDGGAWQALAVGSTITPAGKSFNPSNAAASFIGASSYLNSVALAAYRGVVPQLTKAGADTLVGLLGAISYEAGLMRTIAVVQAKGSTTTSPITYVQKFSDYCDSLDGSADLDQGAGTGQGLKSGAASNIVARDSNALALARTPAQTLNVLYLSASAVASGGFFPKGINNSNDALRASSDSAITL